MVKKFGMFILILYFVLSGSILYAKGKGDKGNPKGWQTDAPPGLNKYDKEKRDAELEREREKREDELEKEIVKKKTSL